MTGAEALLQYGLTPKESDVPGLRALLEEELANYSWETGNDELIKALCVQLFAYGRVEDSLLIWRAKTTSFDLSCSIDVQILCGAGLELTKKFLEKASTVEATEALDYICSCERAQDFDDFNPTSYVEYYRRYYSAE